jgi:hypothetical protein
LKSENPEELHQQAFERKKMAFEPEMSNAPAWFRLPLESAVKPLSLVAPVLGLSQ